MVSPRGGGRGPGKDHLQGAMRPVRGRHATLEGEYNPLKEGRHSCNTMMGKASIAKGQCGRNAITAR